MKNNLMKFFKLMTPFLILGMMVMWVNAAEPVGENSPTMLMRTDTGQFTGNRINDYLENNGMIVSHRVTGNSGMEWPAGTNLLSNFASGIWFSGMVDGAIRTAVGEYGPEFVSGPWAGDFNANEHQLYIVNKSDLADPLASSDFQNWPADLGAPWVDVDGDGVYSPLPNGPDHPDFIGDQVIWYVMNDGDVATHANIFSTQPLGIEVRMTIWGYNRPDAFGDMMFVKVQAFNKGGDDVTDMYIGLWDDPDLGYAGDDFVGCDTTLSLGYCYNDGADNDYGTAAPAIGYDFFQAAVPGALTDTTYAFGEVMAGWKNLSMSSFTKYINGDDVYTDPNDAQEAYNYMSGYKKDGTPFINSATGLPGKFVHPCDPNNNTGTGGSDDCWVDSDDHASGDRRFLMNVGPFDFMNGDSLELVFGIIMAQASDALSSISLLKQTDELAQLAYDIHFALPPSPPQPLVTVTSTFEEIILEWDATAEDYIAEDQLDLDDNGDPTYFHFEGYNVWQHENLSGTGARALVATYDLVNGITEIWDPNTFDPNWGVNIDVPVQHGTDSGIRRFIHISSDKINGGLPLINDRAYYFTVTAYGYNEIGIPRTLESPNNIFMVRPQKDAYVEPAIETGFSDFDITHSEGGSDGSIFVTVVNPFDVTGDSYEVFFDIGHYYRDVDGVWKHTAYADSVGRFLGRTLDCSGSTITAAALASATVGTVDLTFTFDMVCGSNWVDGIALDLPDDLVINSWEAAGDCSYPSDGQNCVNLDGTLDAGTNTITWGDAARSTFGAFEGGAVWTVNVAPPASYPFDVSYTVYDDGYDLTILDSFGAATVTELGYEFKSLQQWNVLNTTTGELVVVDQTMVSGTYFENIVDGVLVEETTELGEDSNPVFDGIQVIVNGPSNGIHGTWQTANANGSIAGVDDDVNENILWINFLTAPGYPTEQAQGGYVFVTHGGGTANDMDSFYERVFRGANFSRAIPNDFEMRFTTDALANGLGYRRFDDELIIGGVPFELWNMGPDVNDASDDYRMLPAILNDGSPNVDAFGFGGDDPSSGSDNDPSSDWVYWGNPDDMSAGEGGYNSFFAPGIGSTPSGGWTEVIARSRLMNWNRYLGGGGDPATLDSISAELAMPEVGTVIRWITNKPNTIADKFAFSTSSAVASDHAFDCKDINVWPNPYYGYNPEERTPIDYQVHFTDLPDMATIRIYNMAGHLVRKIDHAGEQNEIWNLQNNFSIPVASGMYIAVVEANNCNAVLKIAVVMPEQRIDVY